MTLADRHRIAEQAGLVNADSPSYELHNAALWVAEIAEGKRLPHIPRRIHAEVERLVARAEFEAA